MDISRKKWTEQGLKKLGEVISAGRRKRGLKLRDAANFIFAQTGDSLDHTALSRIENGKTLKPEYNTLEAIAASGLVVDENGDSLTVYDFINIASESNDVHKESLKVSTGIADMCIRTKIAIAMRFYQISQEELEEKILKRKPLATLPIERLREIQEKGDATFNEKIAIYNLLDARGKLFSRQEWLGENCPIEMPDDVLCNDIS